MRHKISTIILENNCLYRIRKILNRFLQKSWDEIIIDAHGNQSGIELAPDCFISNDQVVSFFSSTKARSISLISCMVGAPPNKYLPSLAQRIANATGATVFAPAKKTFANSVLYKNPIDAPSLPSLVVTDPSYLVFSPDTRSKAYVLPIPLSEASEALQELPDPYVVKILKNLIEEHGKEIVSTQLAKSSKAVQILYEYASSQVDRAKMLTKLCDIPTPTEKDKLQIAPIFSDLASDKDSIPLLNDHCIETLISYFSDSNLQVKHLALNSLLTLASIPKFTKKFIDNATLIGHIKSLLETSTDIALHHILINAMTFLSRAIA